MPRQFSSGKEQAIPNFMNRIFEKVQKASIEIAPTSPAEIVKQDLVQLQQNIIKLLTTDHPFLKLVAQYYVDLGGKRFRPMIVLLLSRAIEANKAEPSSTLNPKQLQLAEILEMIHTASLIHDDVIDEADTRRGVTSIGNRFSNKLAVLAGDYLLARASVSLSWLENHQVTRLISTVIADLVEGEFMQLKPNPVKPFTVNGNALGSTFDHYLRKTYLKTASLIANGCQSAAILAGESPEVVKIATEYGENLGLCFQIVDDLLDYTGNAETLGKPAAADLNLGLATAPVLFAMEEHKELEILVARKFNAAGDVQKAQELVSKSKGIERTRELAQVFCNKAVEAVMQLKPSTARDALVELAVMVVQRNK